MNENSNTSIGARRCFKSGPLIAFAISCFMMFYFLAGVDASATQRKCQKTVPKMSGSACEYRMYRGAATIVSIRRAEKTAWKSGPEYNPYEVFFVYSTDAQIEEQHGQVKGRRIHLKLTNSWYPGPKYLKKYAIEEGKAFDCYLKVITRGTCTPVVFDFPDIDLSDYFEKDQP